MKLTESRAWQGKVCPGIPEENKAFTWQITEIALNTVFIPTRFPISDGIVPCQSNFAAGSLGSGASLIHARQ